MGEGCHGAQVLWEKQEPRLAIGLAGWRLRCSGCLSGYSVERPPSRHPRRMTSRRMLISTSTPSSPAAWTGRTLDLAATVPRSVTMGRPYQCCQPRAIFVLRGERAAGCPMLAVLVSGYITSALSADRERPADARVPGD